MASFAQVIGQIRDQYTQFSIGKKISFMLIFTFLLAGFIALIWWAGRPEFRILYTDLTAEDANSVVTHLKEQKVSYEISRGGTAISVPVGQYYDVRMSLANAGLPTGGAVGFELFDRDSIGLSSFQMKIAYLRALQGELARTIQQLSSIDAARVHLVMPEESLFQEDQTETTASVVVKMVANARLTDDQVQGVIHLISSSVEGLNPTNVTVIDQKGRVLSKRTDESAGSDVAEKAVKLESELEQRIVGLLARSVGPDKVAAKVSLVLDRQHVQQVVEEYNPDGQVVRSEQIITSEDTGSETNTSAFPGVESNVPESSYQEGRSQKREGTKRQETINYEITRTTSTITQGAGRIKNMSIAVLIDGTYKEVKDEEGNVTQEYTPRTDEEMATFTEVIKKAVGFSKERDDQIEVANIRFLTERVQEGRLIGDRTGFYIQIMNYALAILGGLIFLFFVVRPLVRWLTSEPSLESQLGLPAGMLKGATVGEIEAQLTGVSPPAGLPAGIEGAPSGEKFEDRLKKLEEQRTNLLETAARDRKAVTLMVRRWLKEEEGGSNVT